MYKFKAKVYMYHNDKTLLSLSAALSSFSGHEETQNQEEKSERERSRAPLKALLIIAGIIILAVTASVSARLLLPTRPGWQLIPLKHENVFSQNPILWLTGRCYAQKPLIQALSEAGKILKGDRPEAKIAYLDASGRNGGKLLGHLSHKYGRDIDICFIGRDDENELQPSRPQLLTVGYRLNYGQDGRCGTLTFDRRANLFLILSLLGQQAVTVQKIFVEPYIRTWLIEEAEKAKIPARTIQKLKQILRYAGKNAAKHDDHLHVRFGLSKNG